MTAMTMTDDGVPSAGGEPAIWRWEHVPDKGLLLSGASGPVQWVQGWGALALGSYVTGHWIVDVLTGRPFANLFSLLIVLVAGLGFIGMGFLALSMSRKSASLARFIEIQNGEVSVRFWWRWRRGELRFFARDLVAATYWHRGKPKGYSMDMLRKPRLFVEALANLPYEPCEYRVQVRGQKDFYITGKEERVLEAVRRLELERGRQQAAQAGWAEPAQPNERDNERGKARVTEVIRP
jgi:hypothetical protein